MILNKRQTLILQELENSNDLITAQFLADKFGVSLRTLRNDITEITDYIKGKNVEFVKIHGVGMKIVSKTGNSIAKELQKDYVCKDFAFYPREIRGLFLALSFLFNKNPVTSQYLSDKYLISKGTVLNELKMIHDNPALTDVEIVGVKNKGFILQMEGMKQISLCQKILNSYGASVIENVILSKENALLNHNIREALRQCLNYLDNNMFLVTTDKSYLVFFLAYLLTNIVNSEGEKHKHTVDNTSSFGQFSYYVEYLTGKALSDYHIEVLRFILTSYTDYTDDEYKDNAKLELAVDEWIEDMTNVYPSIYEEKDTLHIDLVKHLKSRISSSMFNIEHDNPLLDEIISKYGDVFENVKRTSQKFCKRCNVSFNDDELGYVTLYFCRSLEKIRRIHEARVMVVCNTGRGASKFLATRIMNNCPEVHIVAMNSYVALEKDKAILDNIDLIISTIPLPEVIKPYVIVSPLLTEAELIKIREAVWIAHSYHANISKPEVNDTITQMAGNVVSYKEAKKFNNRISGQKTMLSSNPYEMDTVILYTTIDIEISELFAKLFPATLTEEQVRAQIGLRVHILMSIIRWARGEFIGVGDLKNYKQEDPERFELVLNFLKSLEEILNLPIDEVEATSIMQYLK